MSETTSSTSSTPVSDELSLEGARRYLRRRRLLLTLPVAMVIALVTSRAVKAYDRAQLLERCEQQRRSSELIVDVARTLPGVVLVSGPSRSFEPPPFPPANGDVVIGAHGAYLVGAGRVLPLDRSCAKAVR